MMQCVSLFLTAVCFLVSPRSVAAAATAGDGKGIGASIPLGSALSPEEIADGDGLSDSPNPNDATSKTFLKPSLGLKRLAARSGGVLVGRSRPNENFRKDDSVPLPTSTTLRPPPPESPRLKARIVTLNVMVAGLSGLGKTTACAALLESWTGATASPDQPKKTNKLPIVRSSTKLIDASRLYERRDAGANTILRVRIVDTPGFGNRVNHKDAVAPIANYVRKCRLNQYKSETSSYLPDYSQGEGTQTDKLVHVCLYFLSPGRFLEIDRHFLRKIQREVVVVPVISKADTLTDEEISHYRAELLHAFDRERIDVYDFDAESKSLARTAAAPIPLRRGRRSGEPLAVISRDGFYPWGESKSYDPHHSDLCLVRDLLLSHHTEKFLELARDKYGVYRARRIGMRRIGDALRYAMLGLLTVRTVAPAVRGIVDGVVVSSARSMAKNVIDAIFAKASKVESPLAEEEPRAKGEDEAPLPPPLDVPAPVRTLPNLFWRGKV